VDLLDLIFPRNCLVCGKGNSYICLSCLSKVKTIKSFCPVCKKSSIDGMTHSGCKTPLGLDGLISVWRYEGVIRKAILTLKYRFGFDIAKELSLLSAKNLNNIYHLSNSTLVPIPLHKSRERWRGFNQSEKLGKIIASELGLQFISDLLIKKVPTKSQTELKKGDRAQNVQGVFALNPNFLLPSAKCLVLFDDVWTTGSTMKEACKVLKRAGIKNVWGLTIAS
jgi:ComF family protein